MKKLITIIILMGFTILANAQSKEEMKKAWAANTKMREDMKAGKYIKSGAHNLYTGQWISSEPGKEIEFLITTKKNRNKFKDHDYYYDALYIEIKKCIYKGEDVAKKIKESIMLPSGDSLRYGSMFFKDPITGDEIIIKIYYINKNNLKLNVNTKYAPGTSTIFPLGNTILKRKGKEK